MPPIPKAERDCKNHFLRPMFAFDEDNGGALLLGYCCDACLEELEFPFPLVLGEDED